MSSRLGANGKLCLSGTWFHRKRCRLSCCTQMRNITKQLFVQCCRPVPAAAHLRTASHVPSGHELQSHPRQQPHGTAAAMDHRTVQKPAWKPAMSASPAKQLGSMPPRPAPARVIRRVTRPLENQIAPPTQLSFSQPASFQEYTGSQNRQYMMPASQPDDFVSQQGVSLSQSYSGADEIEYTPVHGPNPAQPRSAGISQARSAISYSPGQQHTASQLQPAAGLYGTHSHLPQRQPSPGLSQRPLQHQTLLQRQYNPPQSQPAAFAQNLHSHSSSGAVQHHRISQLSQDTFPDETQADPMPSWSAGLPQPNQQQAMAQDHASISQQQLLAPDLSSPCTTALPTSDQPGNRLLMKLKSRAAAAAISNAAPSPLPAITCTAATSPIMLAVASCGLQTDSIPEAASLSAEAAEQISQAVAAAVAAQDECRSLGATVQAASDKSVFNGQHASAQVAAVAMACANLSTAVASLHSISDVQAARLSSVEATCQTALQAIQSLASQSTAGFAALAAQLAEHLSKPMMHCHDQGTQTPSAAVSQCTQATQTELPASQRHDHHKAEASLLCEWLDASLQPVSIHCSC